MQRIVRKDCYQEKWKTPSCLNNSESQKVNNFIGGRRNAFLCEQGAVQLERVTNRLKSKSFNSIQKLTVSQEERFYSYLKVSTPITQLDTKRNQRKKFVKCFVRIYFLQFASEENPTSDQNYYALHTEAFTYKHIIVKFGVIRKFLSIIKLGTWFKNVILAHMALCKFIVINRHGSTTLYFLTNCIVSSNQKRGSSITLNRHRLSYRNCHSLPVILLRKKRQH